VSHQPPATFGEWLAERRKEKGLTQESLGEKARLSADTIRAWESNARRRRHKPQPANLRRVFEALDRDPAEFPSLIRWGQGGPSPFAPTDEPDVVVPAGRFSPRLLVIGLAIAGILGAGVVAASWLRPDRRDTDPSRTPVVVTSPGDTPRPTVLPSLSAKPTPVRTRTASATEPIPSGPPTTCLGESCDGLDPAQTGCADETYAFTIERVSVVDAESQPVGWVELRGSTACMASWPRVENESSDPELALRTYLRDGAGELLTETEFVGTGEGIFGNLWSMSPDRALKACGVIGSFDEVCTDFHTGT
jgi:transcriptional regulator with XRE-family HTH domain